MKTNFGYHLKTLHLDKEFQDKSVVGIYAMHRPALLIRDPDIIRSVFVKNFDNFPSHFARTDPKVDPIGSIGIILVRYKVWKKLHGILAPLFSYGKVKQMYPRIQEVGKKLQSLLNGKGPRFTIDMKYLASLYTLDSIGSTLYDIQPHTLENPKSSYVTEILRMAEFNLRRSLDFLLIVFLPHLAGIFRAKFFCSKSEQFIDATVSEIMKTREKSNTQRNDLIQLLLKLKENPEFNNDGMPPVKDYIVSIASFLMFGGFETSATTSSSVLLELAKNPEIQIQLRDEIHKAWLEGKGGISHEIINKMEYLDKVIYETLRMYPPIPMLDREHIRSEDGKLFSLKPHYDYQIPDGMPIFISIYGLHYDPKYWPNPYIFNPERFSEQAKSSRNPMTFLPFGAGPRKCLGYQLAMLQVKVFLMNFLKNHKVQVCNKTPLNGELEAKSLILQVKGGVHLETIRDNMYDDSLGVL
ncbi:cytochrome P450 6g1-like [Haematobia irritans]|uniref:cytochrome P450 6g1-like n=1 Tax=Haematobia irritans TaxID=7368 RepID=UPI003F4FCEE5